MPNYEVSWLATNNNVSQIGSFTTSDSSATVIHTKQIDLTNSLSNLVTGQKYFLLLTPLDNFANVNVSYTAGAAMSQWTTRKYQTANRNMKEVIFDKWRRQLQIRGELVIEGYLNTNAFQ